MARILICDDDEQFLHMVSSYLEAKGHVVSTCADAGQLAAILSHESADLLIVDMQMPAGGGPAVAQFLRSKAGDTPNVLVVSGMPVPLQAQWFQGLKATFLEKPVDLRRLNDAVDAGLAA